MLVGNLECELTMEENKLTCRDCSPLVECDMFDNGNNPLNCKYYNPSLQPAKEIINTKIDWDINTYQLQISNTLLRHKIENVQLTIDLQGDIENCIQRDRISQDRKNSCKSQLENKDKMDWSNYCAHNTNRSQCKKENCLLFNICLIKEIKK
jgi:hypothetical protein